MPRLKDSSTAPEAALRRDGKRNIRDGLFRDQRGKCCYCGCQMVMRYERKRGEQMPSNVCTLEHTIPKGHFMRGRRQVYKAACFKCNNDRSSPEQFERAKREQAAEDRFRREFRLYVEPAKLP